MPRPELTSVRLERGEVCSRGAGSSGSGQDEEGPAKESAGAAGSPGGGDGRGVPGSLSPSGRGSRASQLCNPPSFPRILCSARLHLGDLLCIFRVFIWNSCGLSN